MKKPIDHVTAVQNRLESNMLFVDATGTTNWSGWTDGELRLEDQTEEALILTFVATPPGAVSSPVVTEITARTFEIPLMPPIPRYIVVRSAGNEIRVAIGKELVYSVTSVKAELRGTLLHVSANGEATENGWTDGELVPQQSDQSGDPLLFYFMATRGGALPVLTPIAAEPFETLLRPPFPEKVKVHAASNDRTADVEGAISAQPPASGQKQATA